MIGRIHTKYSGVLKIVWGFETLKNTRNRAYGCRCDRNKTVTCVLKKLIPISAAGEGKGFFFDKDSRGRDLVF